MSLGYTAHGGGEKHGFRQGGGHGAMLGLQQGLQHLGGGRQGLRGGGHKGRFGGSRVTTDFSTSYFCPQHIS